MRTEGGTSVAPSWVVLGVEVSSESEQNAALRDLKPAAGFARALHEFGTRSGL